jgi:hypothetical protein
VSDGDVLRACRRRAARGADGKVKEHGLCPAICSASLKSCGGRVDTESCTAQAIMSQANISRPMGRCPLASGKLSRSHDRFVYAARRWDTREGREQWLLPSENSRFGVARRQGGSACRPLIRRALAAPHLRRSPSNQSLAVFRRMLRWQRIEDCACGRQSAARNSVIRVIPPPCSWDCVMPIAQVARRDDTKQCALHRAGNCALVWQVIDMVSIGAVGR